MTKLTVERLKSEARAFADIESGHDEPSLFGVTDGKAVGTYLEHKFQAYLREKYKYEEGSSAKGVDFPGLAVDMKVTSIRQPQSSCPYKYARQKIYGLGYSLLIFVYEKIDNPEDSTSRLNILHVISVEAKRTADFQMTTGLLSILNNDGNKDDLISFMNDRMLPVEEIEASTIAEELLENHPQIGYLTISNALQWRLQYQRVLDKAGTVQGVDCVK